MKVRKKRQTADVDDQQELFDGKGRSIPSRYQKAPGRDVDFDPPSPHRLRLFIVGSVGDGKSTFCASIPRALILDIENKYTAIPHRGKDTMIRHCQTVEDYLKLLDLAIQDGQAGNPYFKMIVIDPIDGFVRLIRDSLTVGFREANLLKAGNPRDIASFGQEGAGWDEINRAVTMVLFRIYQAGYGYTAISHVLPSWKKMEGGHSVQRWEHVLNAGIYKYLYVDCEFTLTLGSEEHTEQVATGRVLKVGNRRIKERQEETRQFYCLSVDSANPRVPVRAHVPMGDEPIEIPEGRGWPCFCKSYLEAVERRRQDASQPPSVISPS